MDRPSFTIGIEEEYLIVERQSRDLVREPPDAFLETLTEALGGRVAPEFLQCQVEVGTAVHATVAEAVAELAAMRAEVARVAAAFGFAPIAASTHPFANWRDQSHTRRPRYDALFADLGLAVRRLMICGCHVHVGIEDPDLRIDLMNQASYFLPHILALSCSSPFWEGEDTGMASYRLNVFDTLPRTGLPDRVESYGEFERLVGRLVQAGCIEDATKIWWDIRPSAKFPTLEMRIADICPRLEDTAAIAAVYQSLTAYLFRLRSLNQRWRIYPETLIRENRWRAQRYGSSGELVDHGKAAAAPLADLVGEMIALMTSDAAELGCAAELEHARTIAIRGSGAERQRAVLAAAEEAGANRQEALEAVVDSLIDDFTA